MNNPDEISFRRAVHYMIPLACGLAIPREFSKDWHIGKFFNHHQLIRRIA
jgi:hypothetical protein